MRLSVSGIIACNEDARIYKHYGYDAFSPAMMRQALTDCPEGETLELEVNSCGGDVFAGFEIYSILRDARIPTVAKVQSLAASAASTIISACNQVQMSPVAQIMIHLPTCGAYGDRFEHVAAAQSLDSITESILNGYERKVGGKTSREELARMMRSETWLSAARAVECGLADGIIGSGTPSIANAFGIPDIEQLRSQYAAENQHQSWQAEASVELENMKNFLKGTKTYA